MGFGEKLKIKKFKVKGDGGLTDPWMSESFVGELCCVTEEEVLHFG
jgi:hypothetical protein